MKALKSQISIYKLQINSNDQNSKSQVLNIEYWNCNLPFDVAQGGEPVEPFVIWVLLFACPPSLWRGAL
jgi:hypothetical protein